ncbi:MAG: RagB/SusD family nutrient uptake outer membrane protein [Prevotella sp.]|nr:RagB/SusD family nutrient uptake outer membrane protein [Prevotella sp.]
MKIYIKSLLACLLAMPLATSCTDYLDKAPGSDINPTDPYKNYTNFQGFIEELYNCIPCITATNWHQCWNYGEEEMIEPGNRPRFFSNDIDEGNYWGWNTTEYSHFKTGYNDVNDGDSKKHAHYYGYCWYGIRKANMGIANLDKIVQCSQEERKLIEGQLYFFRGFFHFMLMQYWGGLPYIDKDLTGQPLNLPRLTYQETADKVAADLQHAAELLPVDWDQTATGKPTLGNNNLRINKIMALSFLGKNYLYAGSPLMNKASGGNAAYNAEYCKKAADVFGQVLQLCKTTGRYELAPWDSYQQVFITYNQGDRLPGLKEAIFFEDVRSGMNRYRWNQINDWASNEILPSGIKIFPTANYADYFGMANGKPIKDITKADPESGYDPEYPWRNRDPRFYYNFVYDGVNVVKDGSSINNDKELMYASLYTDGKFRTLTPTKACMTGYINKKFCHQWLNMWDGYRDGVGFFLQLMRLADVYLMYSEAVANGYGSISANAGGFSMSALDAVNAIRDRAGVGHVDAAYTGSVDKFMEEVRRERAVELSFEGHRFNDLRRWLLLDKAPYNQKKAVYFDRGSEPAEIYADPQNAKVLNLREEVLIQRKFSEKHYWFPFLRDDTYRFEEFKQNPGW